MSASQIYYITQEQLESLVTGGQAYVSRGGLQKRITYNSDDIYCVPIVTYKYMISGTTVEGMGFRITYESEKYYESVQELIDDLRFPLKIDFVSEEMMYPVLVSAMDNAMHIIDLVSFTDYTVDTIQMEEIQ